MWRNISNQGIKYRFFLWKAYLDKGMGFLSPTKYILASYGLFAQSTINLLVVGFLWLLTCLIVGRCFYIYEWIKIENEIQNQYNPFQVEVRDKLKNS
jgi:hypothetical protein